MLEQLRNVNVDRMDLDEVVALLTFGEQLQANYTANALEVPEWITDKTSALKKEAQRRRRDNLEAALKSAVARKEALKTADQKRADTDAEIERLKAALAA